MAVQSANLILTNNVLELCVDFYIRALLCFVLYFCSSRNGSGVMKYLVMEICGCRHSHRPCEADIYFLTQSYESKEVVRKLYIE
jgi:hypothetical protein